MKIETIEERDGQYLISADDSDEEGWVYPVHPSRSATGEERLVSALCREVKRGMGLFCIAVRSHK